MKKLIIILLICITGFQYAEAQNHVVVTKWILPQKTTLVAVPQYPPIRNQMSFGGFLLAMEPEDVPLLLVNNEGVFKTRRIFKKPIKLFTEISFADMLENRLNGLKSGWVSTYDDHISELFSDAPSLVRFVCSIPLK